METIKLWARKGDAVRQAIEVGELVHLDTASEELTDAFLLFAIRSGQVQDRSPVIGEGELCRIRRDAR